MYEVIILVEVESVTDLNLLEGMTASVDIIIERRADVLYIPVAALKWRDNWRGEEARCDRIGRERPFLVPDLPMHPVAWAQFRNRSNNGRRESPG